MSDIDFDKAVEKVNAEADKKESPYKYWMKEIDAAKKREKDYRKSAKEIVEIYEGDKTDEIPFNILYSNTETLQPALYSQLPRVVIERRFKDEDQLGKTVATVVARAISYLLDDNDEDGTSMDSHFQSVVLSSLVPGRGILRFKYSPVLEEIPVEGSAPESGDSSDPEKPESTPNVISRVVSETIECEEVPWDNFYHGYASQWKKVPWIAFKLYMGVAEFKKEFPNVKEIPSCDASSKTDEYEEGVKESDEEADLITVYEIWDKLNRRVYFLAPECKDELLRDVPDPLELSGFYPCPEPLTFLHRIKDKSPIPLYSMYEAQAKELNAITVRIRMITAALKVRGFYDSSLTELATLLSSGDNTLLPTSNLAIAYDKGLDKVLWFMPLEELAGVLNKLSQQREEIKQVIYEITGMSDIIRGSSMVSETATAQGLKDKWGSLRLKYMQRATALYIRSCIRIMGELISNHFGQETLAKMTNLNFPTMEVKMQVQAQAQQMQMMAQQTGQEPPPMPQQMQQILEMPTWEDIMGVLNDDMARRFKVDLETNSTVDVDATSDKEAMAEFLNALSQFLNGMMPMVQQGILPFEAMQSILMAVVRRFSFGTEVEDQLRKMQPPQPQQGPDPEELAKREQELQAKEAELQKQGMAMQESAAKAKLDLEIESERAKAKLEVERDMVKFEKAQSMMEINASKQQALDEITHEQKMADIALKDKEDATGRRIQSKQSMSDIQIKEAHKKLEERAAELGDLAQEVDPVEIVKPMIAVISESMDRMSKIMAQGVIAASAIQKKAVKNPDGSWQTITLTDEGGSESE